MANFTRRQFLETSAAGLVFASGLTGTGLSAVAAEGEELVFTIQMVTVGPLGFSGRAAQPGWIDVSNWINDNGGIRGRPIRLVFYESEYKLDVAMAGWKRALASNKNVVFSLGDSTPFIRAATPINNQDYKLLMSSLANASDLIDTQKYPYHFLAFPVYSDMVAILLKYINSKATPDKKPTVAIVHSDSEFGRDPLPVARERAKALGIDIVLEEETPLASLDVTSSAIKLRNANADYIIFHGYAGNVWPELLQLARDYGVTGQSMGTMYAMDPDIVKQIGAAADGYMGFVPYNLTMTNATGPMMKLIESYVSKSKADYAGYANIAYMHTWVTTLLIKQALEKTIDAGKPLDGPNLIEAIAAIKDWDSGGIIDVPVTLRDHRIATGRLMQYSFKDGMTLNPISDWISAAD